MTARKFTDEQDRELLRRYNEEEISSIDLAKEHGCSYAAIQNAIKRAGGTLRPVGKGGIKFTDEQDNEIREKYDKTTKYSLDKLAKEYKCSSKAIENAIKRAGGNIRTPHEANFIFTPEQDQAIWRKYKETKISITKLAEEYACEYRTIKNAILRAGGRPRSVIEANSLFSPEESKKIRQKHEKNGICLSALAKEYGCSKCAIASAIKRAGGAYKPNMKSAPIAEKSEEITKELLQIVNSLGPHISSLPRKSWLAILRQSKAFKNISDRSVLTPVKIQLLKGELKPEDILPPAPEPDAPADAPPPVSKLQERN